MPLYTHYVNGISLVIFEKICHHTTTPIKKRSQNRHLNWRRLKLTIHVGAMCERMGRHVSGGRGDRLESVYRFLYYKTNLECLDDLVFTSMTGKPIDPGVISHTFARIAIQVGLNGVRFHDLRHTFASLMLLRGAKPKVISEALGHSNVGFTLDVYSHIIDGMQTDAMALLDEVLPAGVSQNNNANLTPKTDIVALIT